MATERPKRIHLLGDGRHEEAVAAVAITPGMLIELDTNNKVKPHASAAALAERNFALEDALQGRTIEDVYAIGELVGYVAAGPGEVVYAWLASGEDVSASEKLTSNGDGMLKAATGSDAVVGVALEARNLSDSDTDVDSRIRVRLL